MHNVVKIFDNTLEYIPADKGLNYIICSEFNEVFFGVYQITINGVKFIGEGVDSIKGTPVVKIPVVIEGKEHATLFALKSNPDETGVVININSLSDGRQIVLDEKKAVEEIAEEIDIELIDEAVEEPTNNVESISVNIERYKQDALRVISENFKEKKAKLENLQDTLKEFIAENVNEIKQSTLVNLDDFKADVLNSVETIVESNKIDTDSSIAEINALKENISVLVNGYITDLEFTSSEKVAALDELREQVTFEVSTQLNDFESKVSAYKQYTEDEFKKLENYIIESEKNLAAQNESGLEASKVILDSVVEKTANIEKFVASKVTAIQSFTDKKAASIAKILEKKLSEFDSKTKIVDEKVDLIEKTLSEKVVDYIGEFTAAVNEKFSGIDTIKADIESAGETQTSKIQQIGEQLIEAVEAKVKNVNLVAVKKEDLTSLKKQLEERINTESANLKKYVAGYGGGGAVAQQLAAGGTINGTLNIARGQILSGGIDLADIFTGGGGSGYQTLTFTESSAQLTISPNGNTVSLSALSGGGGGTATGAYLPLSGGTVTGTTIFTGTLSATLIEAISANFTVIDIKQYELSGFNVEGNVTVSGIISSNNIVNANGGNSNNWNSTYTTLNVNSGSWDSVYSTVNSNSATDWNYQGSDIKALTANWENTYTDFSSQSSSNVSVYSTVNSKSGSWNSVYSSFNAQSGANASVYSSVNSNSASWDNVYSTVNSNSATQWNYQGTDIKALTANWQNTYSTVNTTSASWLQTLTFDEITSTLSISNSNSVSLSALNESSVFANYLPLSGGTLTGPVSTNQDIEITDSTKGIILISPSNFKYRVTVNDAGELVTTLV